MRVIATATGFDGTKLQEIGMEFNLPDETPPGSWFEPVDPKKKEAYFKKRDDYFAQKKVQQAQSKAAAMVVDTAGLRELVETLLTRQEKSLLAVMQRKTSDKKEPAVDSLTS
jgi:pheromone shutdown protein TraB